MSIKKNLPYTFCEKCRCVWPLIDKKQGVFIITCKNETTCTNAVKLYFKDQGKK